MTKRKRLKPQKQRYSLIHEIGASPTEPLPKEWRTAQLTSMWDGLADIEKQANPPIASWDVVSDAVNLLETLVLEMGVADDPGGLLKDATNAMAEAGKRHVATGAPIRLTGPGIFAVRSVLEDYAVLLEVLPARTMIRCHRLTEKRIYEIRTGKRRAHDVSVISL